jgi:hypothetical protein
MQAVQIGGVGDLARIRDRVDAGGDGRFHFGKPPAQAGRERGAGLVEGMDGGGFAGRLPRDGGEARALGDRLQASLAHALTLPPNPITHEGG